MAPKANATHKSKPTQSDDPAPASSSGAASRSEAKTAPQRRTRSSHAPEPVTGLAKVRQILRDPQAFRAFRESLPAWTDEVGAFALILLGLLTFSALLNPTGDIAAPIANALQIAFGVGAFVIATAVVLLGAILLLPRAGFAVKLSWTRVLAFEVLFMALQALFHILTFADEPRALAREGEGGGYVGWAISSISISAIGERTSILLFSGIVVFSLGALVGVQRRGVRAFVLGFSDLLGGVANWLRPRPLWPSPQQDVTDHSLDDVLIDDERPASPDDKSNE